MKGIDLESFREPIRFIRHEHRIKYVSPDGKEFFDKWEFEKHMIGYNLDKEFAFIKKRVEAERKDRVISYLVFGAVLISIGILCLFL